MSRKAETRIVAVVLPGDRHPWDALREFPTVREDNHESLYRSYHVLNEVRMMLERGDSIDTILSLILWVERGL